MPYLGALGGMPHQEKFAKLGLLRLNLVIILSEKYMMSLEFSSLEALVAHDTIAPLEIFRKWLTQD